MKSLDLRRAALHTGNTRFSNVTPWLATAEKGVGQRSPKWHYLAGSCPEVQDSADRSGVLGFPIAACDFAGRQWRHTHGLEPAIDFAAFFRRPGSGPRRVECAV